MRNGLVRYSRRTDSEILQRLITASSCNPGGGCCPGIFRKGKIMELTELFNELEGEKCRCGAKKVSMQTFCGKCYRSLSPEKRRALYNRIGQGYEEAYADAVNFLDGDEN